MARTRRVEEQVHGKNGTASLPPDPFPEAQRGDAHETVVDVQMVQDSPEGQKPSPKVEVMNAPNLLSAFFPDPRWAVPGIIPEGLTVLGGKPKLGKSWLALNIALAVASGGEVLGRRAEQGEVLYLALEDSWRRLQGRVRKLLSSQYTDAPPLMHVAREWPRQDDGGILALEAWLDAHPDTRLVAIDTWVRFRPLRAGRGGDSYEEDSGHSAQVKKLADQRGLAALVVTHCRKLPAEDPHDELLATTGFFGTADGSLVLRRLRGQKDAELHGAGRDMEEEFEMALQWDAQHCLWVVSGQGDNDAERHLPPDQRRIRQILREQETPLGVLEFTAKLNRPYNAVAQMLSRMVKDGLLSRSGYGRYALPDADLADSMSNCQTHVSD